MLSSFRRSALVAAVALAASVATIQPAVAAPAAPAAVAAQPSQPAPAGDEFYTAPNPLPAGEPGDIVRWRSTGTNSWQVMYLSTNALDQPNVVTGTLLTPPGVTDLAAVPVVGFAVGTQGPAFKCVASKGYQSGLLYEKSVIDGSLQAGYAVAVTDYEGYSATTTPTYINGKAQGHAVLDSVRALRNLEQAGVGDDGPVAVQGYSQGGAGSLWAAELQPEYAPELDLVGAIGGGVPADLNEVATFLDGGIGFGFLAFAAVGLDVAYPELDLDSYLNDTGRTQLADAKANFCLVELLGFGGKRISDFTTSNPIMLPDWQARLVENRLGQNPPQVPVFQYHGVLDEILPFAQAQTLSREYCAAGVEMTFTSYLAEHAFGIFAGVEDSKKFLADRFAGVAPTSNC